MASTFKTLTLALLITFSFLVISKVANADEVTVFSCDEILDYAVIENGAGSGGKKYKLQNYSFKLSESEISFSENAGAYDKKITLKILDTTLQRYVRAEHEFNEFSKLVFYFDGYDATQIFASKKYVRTSFAVCNEF